MTAPRRTLAEWRTLLDRHARSGLSLAAFAKREGLRPTTLSWWRWKLGASRATSTEESPRFVQLEVQARAAAGYELELGDQVRLHIPAGFDEVELAGLLRALRELC